MKNLLYSFLGAGIRTDNIKVQPFFNPEINIVNTDPKPEPFTSFIYPSAGYEYKNHHNLVRAWHLLGEEGIFPGLYLTINSRDKNLSSLIDSFNSKYGKKIINLGEIEHKKILDFYRKVSALIFPSKAESFGLPLYEASMLGLPIIASELDYVRDACIPCETFDPNAPLSIARAVKRFMKIGNEIKRPLTGEEFLNNLTLPKT